MSVSPAEAARGGDVVGAHGRRDDRLGERAQVLTPDKVPRALYQPRPLLIEQEEDGRWIGWVHKVHLRPGTELTTRRGNAAEGSPGQTLVNRVFVARSTLSTCGPPHVRS